MNNLFGKLAVVALTTVLLAGCGGGGVEVSPEMQDFMGVISITSSMSDAITKHGKDPDMTTELDLYDLKEPSVTSVENTESATCYVMNVKHGMIDSNCKVCWESGKVVSVDYIE